ncbi:MAG TPA: TetR/AcrR family transcriptional regulator [Caulobacteraceae bacterium]|nr:TetR/AcrR family transcriptional regulator [Caulobacteraceae bacterium]
MPRTLSQTDIEDFRERLCDAAEHLFAERGAEGVTIRELAAAVGVSAMTPYRYFKDKDAILAAVRARAFDRHAEALEAAYAAAGSDPAARPGALADAYVRFAEENPEAYKLMFDVRQPSAGDYPELVRAGSRSYRTMTLQLSEKAAEGALPGDPEKIGQMYWAALHGPLMLQMSGLLDRETARTLIHDLLATLDKGLWGEARPGL